MQNDKVIVTVRGCTVEVGPYDGGVHIRESGLDHADGSRRYESAFHVESDGSMIGQGFVGNVADGDEILALDEALREAIAQARARWPEVESIFADRNRLCARR